VRAERLSATCFLYLEIFDLVVTFGGYAILKPGKWNENRAGRRSRAVHVCAPNACPPRVVASALRRTDPRSRRGGPCTVVPPPLFSPCAALTRGLAPSQGHASARVPACTACTHALGQLAPACRPCRISLSLSCLHRRHPNLSRDASSPFPLCPPSHAITRLPPNSSLHPILTSFRRIYSFSTIHQKVPCTEFASARHCSTGIRAAAGGTPGRRCRPSPGAPPPQLPPGINLG
jgi:hypothetical protein